MPSKTDDDAVEDRREAGNHRARREARASPSGQLPPSGEPVGVLRNKEKKEKK